MEETYLDGHTGPIDAWEHITVEGDFSFVQTIRKSLVRLQRWVHLRTALLVPWPLRKSYADAGVKGLSFGKRSLRR